MVCKRDVDNIQLIALGPRSQILACVSKVLTNLWAASIVLTFWARRSSTASSDSQHSIHTIASQRSLVSGFSQFSHLSTPGGHRSSVLSRVN